MKKIIILIFILTSCQPTTQNNITPYTRDTSSGTREAFFKNIDFKEAIKDDSVLTKKIAIVDGNGDMISKLKNDDNGIGYISLSSLKHSTLKPLEFENIEANITNVLNKTYNLQRPFLYIKREEYKSETNQKIIEAYVDYMSTIEGISDILNAEGIIDTTTKTWDQIKQNHEICQNDNSKITIKFGGSTSVKPVAEELSKSFSKKCGNFIAEHNHTGSSDGFKRTNGSEKDTSNYIDIGFTSRELDKGEKTNQSGIICLDAVVIVVNKQNPINKIDQKTLKQIYDGKLKIWGEIDEYNK